MGLSSWRSEIWRDHEAPDPAPLALERRGRRVFQDRPKSSMALITFHRKTVLARISPAATDPGTDDLTFTWTFPDGSVVTHTFFNNGVSPDPRPSSLGPRPMTATDSLEHSLCQPCGKAISLTVSDDDGGVTTLVFTIKP